MRRHRPGLRRQGPLLISLLTTATTATTACLYDPPDCDSDRDGYRSVACGADDCDDSRPDVHPGAADPWDLEWELGEVTASGDLAMGMFAIGPDDVPYLLFQTAAPDDEPIVPMERVETDTVLLRRVAGGWVTFERWDGEPGSGQDVPYASHIAFAGDSLFVVLDESGLTSTPVTGADWVAHPAPQEADVGYETDIAGSSSTLEVALPGFESIWLFDDRDRSFLREPVPALEGSRPEDMDLTWDADGSLYACWTQQWQDHRGIDILLVTREDTGAWSAETIDSVEGFDEARCDVATGSNGGVDVAYHVGDRVFGNEIHVASLDEGAWKREILSEAAEVTGRSGGWLALDPMGRGHATFVTEAGCDEYGCESVDMVHAVEREDGWDLEMIKSFGAEQHSPHAQFIGVDSYGRASIAFRDGPSVSPPGALGGDPGIWLAYQVDRVDEACDGP